MLYMAQLEDKIKQEVQAREQLAIHYQNSLNRGVTVMNNETALLAESPLIKEISIVVAKQLLQKSKEDPKAINQLLTKEQREQLLALQTSIDRKSENWAFDKLKNKNEKYGSIEI